MDNVVGTAAPLGEWTPNAREHAFSAEAITDAVQRIRDQVHVVGVLDGQRVGVMFDGQLARVGRRLSSAPRLLASIPPTHPEWLGGHGFRTAHRVRFPYIAGEMAHGIATSAMVVAMARAGMLGFYGAGGVGLDELERVVASIATQLGSGETAPSWGSNLIHMPHDVGYEDRVVDVYLRHRVERVSASAFMYVTPAVVRYACTGLTQDPGGRIRRRHHLFAKVSRPEVARVFMSPPSAAIVAELVSAGRLTPAEARLAGHLPLAEDVTVEADSGGHTDNRPLVVLVPQMLALADELAARHGYDRPIRVGAAGCLGTPTAVAAAFGLGASYVLTGSINQCAVEAGMSAASKELLAAATPADVTMAPSPDMFELGVKVQVLKRGTLFPARASLLYGLYTSHESLDEVPRATRERLEREIFRQPIEEVWAETERFWLRRGPAEVARAHREPKHKMALVFRSYVGKASQWAIAGRDDRRADYQLWCGPAMGAFNQWVRGSFLEPLSSRGVVQVGLNLLEGAAVITRAQLLRSLGLAVPARAFLFVPRPLTTDDTAGGVVAAVS